MFRNRFQKKDNYEVMSQQMDKKSSFGMGANGSGNNDDMYVQQPRGRSPPQINRYQQPGFDDFGQNQFRRQSNNGMNHSGQHLDYNGGTQRSMSQESRGFAPRRNMVKSSMSCQDFSPQPQLGRNNLRARKRTTDMVMDRRPISRDLNSSLELMAVSSDRSNRSNDDLIASNFLSQYQNSVKPDSALTQFDNNNQMNQLASLLSQFNANLVNSQVANLSTQNLNEKYNESQVLGSTQTNTKSSKPSQAKKKIKVSFAKKQSKSEEISDHEEDVSDHEEDVSDHEEKQKEPSPKKTTKSMFLLILLYANLMSRSAVYFVPLLSLQSRFHH
jgi:hypothetical protein